MSQERFGLKVLWVGVVSIAAYFLLFAWIERSRNHQGPWEITFTQHSNGVPCLVVAQPVLGIRNVRIVFAGGSLTNTAALPVRVLFNEARPTPFDLPFGRCVFLDTTSLPGTVAIEVAGRQVQLLPRVLTVDEIERPWQSNETMVLPATAGPVAPPQPPGAR